MGKKCPDNHIKGFRQEIGEIAESSAESFFRWFDNSEEKKSISDTFIKGHWEFSSHILAPVYLYALSLKPDTALEIGYGGGRLAAAAAGAFKRVIGVDVHDRRNLVQKELMAKGINNVELFQTEGTTLPVPQGAVSFVYSFIVFQHLQKIDIVNNYLAEIYRVLDKGGMAVIYFGRFCRFSKNSSSRLLFWLDILAERILQLKGYREKSAPVNCTNILINRSYFKKICKKAGFDVLATLTSLRPGGGGRLLYGGQHGVILVKKG